MLPATSLKTERYGTVSEAFSFCPTFTPISVTKQAVVRGTTNPAPVLQRTERPKTAISLHSQSLDVSTGLPESNHITNNLTFDPPTRVPE